MALRTASFVSPDDPGGYVLYDSVTMTAYPVIFGTHVEIDQFLDWYETTYRESFYGSTKAEPYAAYERYVKENANPRR